MQILVIAGIQRGGGGSSRMPRTNKTRPISPGMPRKWHSKVYYSLMPRYYRMRHTAKSLDRV